MKYMLAIAISMIFSAKCALYSFEKHEIERVISYKIEGSKKDFDNLSTYNYEEGVILHFYYLGKIHAYQEMRYYVLPID